MAVQSDVIGRDDVTSGSGGGGVVSVVLRHDRSLLGERHGGGRSQHVSSALIGRNVGNVLIDGRHSMLIGRQSVGGAKRGGGG